MNCFRFTAAAAEDIHARITTTLNNVLRLLLLLLAIVMIRILSVYILSNRIAKLRNEKKGIDMLPLLVIRSCARYSLRLAWPQIQISIHTLTTDSHTHSSIHYNCICRMAINALPVVFECCSYNC